MMKYRIGTRGSRLALIQTEMVKSRLEQEYPDDEFEVVVIRTKGDAVTDRPIAAIGDSSLFTREIENALLDGRIDIAVHSMKDLAADCPSGLTLSKAWKREDPRDVLVCRGGAKSLDDLPKGAVVATGSVRRNAILKRMRSDLLIVDIRGNVDTRLRKLFSPEDGEPELDAIVLAAAGLKRLGRAEVITQYLDSEVMVPSPNQGQLAIELRADNLELKRKLDRLGDDAAEVVACVERDFLRESGADCHLPVGALAEIRGGRLTMRCVCGTCADDLQYETRVAGEVMLVGAGPGDPELITVRGMKAVEIADALVYDRLIPECLVGAARNECDRVYVGKSSGNHTMSQDEINLLLVRKAMRYSRVVRLKGGDPFVFGRGSEEMAYLRRMGVACSSVPGVSSAIAAAESAGIPVTARGIASGFEVVTAHEGAVKCPNTKVYLMGLDRIGEIADELRVEGLPPDTPTAVVSCATTDRERCVVGTLADIAVRVNGLVSPAILIVGNAVNLRKVLGFPLSGRRFLIPVIEGGSRSLSDRIRRLGGAVNELTVGRIVRINGALTLSDLEGVDRIVLTSRNGFLALDEPMMEAIKARGIKVESVREVKPIGNTLHLTQPDADRVEGVRSIDVYRNDEVEMPASVDLGEYDAVLLSCASSARRLGAVAIGRSRLVAIGPKTADAVRKSSLKGDVVVAENPTIDSLCEAVMAIADIFTPYFKTDRKLRWGDAFRHTGVAGYIAERDRTLAP